MGSVNRDIVIAKMWIYINGHIWILTSSYTAAKNLEFGALWQSNLADWKLLDCPPSYACWFRNPLTTYIIIYIIVYTCIDIFVLKQEHP